MHSRTFKLTLIASALALAGCATVSKEEYLAEVERLGELNCQSLEVELILAETNKQLQVIRQLQTDKGCEIRPVMAKGMKKKRDMREPNHWRNDRRYYSGIEASRPEGE